MKISLDYPTSVKAEEDALTLPVEPIVEFSSSAYQLGELVLVARNGNKTLKAKTKTGSVDLSPLLFAGVLEMSVHLIVNGVPAKKWDIVPIVLREVDNALCAFDEIEELRARVAELEKKTTVIV